MRYKVKKILQRITKKDNETMGENHIFLMVRDVTQEIKHLTNEFQKEKIEKRDGRKLSNKYYNSYVKIMWKYIIIIKFS